MQMPRAHVSGAALWARNLLFAGLILSGIAGLAGTTYSKITSAAAPLHKHEPSPPDCQTLVNEINDTFRQQWSAEGVKPAARAADLTIARRLSLALTGTIPSLREIRTLQGGEG